MNRGLFRGNAGEPPYPTGRIIELVDMSGNLTLNNFEIGNASVLRIQDTSTTINGMVPSYDGQQILILVSRNSLVTLTHNSASSDPDYRFQFDASANYTVSSAALLIYDGGSTGRSNTQLRGWKMMALPSISSTAGTFGSATQVAQFTTDGHGRVGVISNVTITGVVPSAHASTHQNGGSDEIATTTAAANAIPKADAIGFLNPAWEGILSCSADQTIANSSTLTTSSYMTFAVSAATKYRVEGLIIADTTAAGDFKYSLTNPGSPTLIRYFESRAAAGATPAFTAPLAAYPAGVSLTATTSNGVYINFWSILHNGANAGNVAFQFAQNSTTNDAGATVRAGSYIKYAIA